MERTLAARLRGLEAKEVSVHQHEVSVHQHAAKVEATKEQVAHMAGKLEALIHANTAAEEALQEERAALSRECQALSKERSALQDTLRQTEKREEAAAALEASVREREDEVLRRQRALAEREADVVRTLEENQGWMEDKARETQEAQRALDQALLEVCEMRESKRTTEAALEAHANLVDALRQQLSAAEGRVQTMRQLDERARELGEREERLGLMADVIDDTAARREAEIDKLAQDADATQQRQLQLLAELENDLKARSAALVAKDEEVRRRELLGAERERQLDERQRQLDNRSLSLDQAQDEITRRQRFLEEHQRGLAEQEREGKADLARQQQVFPHVLPSSFTPPRLGVVREATCADATCGGAHAPECGLAQSVCVVTHTFRNVSGALPSVQASAETRSVSALATFFRTSAGVGAEAVLHHFEDSGPKVRVMGGCRCRRVRCVGLSVQ
jgi:hypothetical protein